MDYLQQGISLRAYAQRDPGVESQREGFEMFATMMDGIKEETVGFLFNLEVQVEAAPAPAPAAEAAPLPMPDDATIEIKAKGLGRASRPQGLQYSAPTIDGATGGGVAVQQAQPTPPAPPAPHAPALGVGGPPAGDRPRPSPGRRPSPGNQAASSSSNGPSRNAPCPCGSGKKYKRCHGAPTAN